MVAAAIAQIMSFALQLLQWISPLLRLPSLFPVNPRLLVTLLSLPPVLWAFLALRSPSASRRNIGTVVLSIVLIWFAILAITPQPGIPFVPAWDEPSRPGNRAPDFALKDSDGKSWKLSDFEGRPVVLYFMASYCYLCKPEMPKLVEVYQKYKDRGLAVLVIDEHETNPAEANSIQSYFKGLGVEFPVLLDKDGNLYPDYGVSSFPTTFFVNAEVIVQDMWIGTIPRDKLQQSVLEICPTCQY